MLFKDRLEVWNPGTLPPTLTLEKLRGPHASVPHNPLLAEPMYLTKYIERMGTGIRDMIRRCRTAGLPELEIRIDGGFFVLTIRRKTSEPGAQSGPGRDQVTPQDTQQVTGQVTTARVEPESVACLVWLSGRRNVAIGDFGIGLASKHRDASSARATSIQPLTDGLDRTHHPRKTHQSPPEIPAHGKRPQIAGTIGKGKGSLMKNIVATGQVSGQVEAQ